MNAADEGPGRDVEELVELEQRFWRADAGYYRRRLSDDALMVFPEPVGVLDRAQTVAGIAGGPRWAQARLDGIQVRHLGEGVVALVYAATARRDGDAAAYRALVTSVYVRRDGEWRLAVHQQSPSPG